MRLYGGLNLAIAVNNINMKNDNHQKIFATILLILTFAIVLVGCSASTPDIASECVRIHIRANSNSQADQQVKLAVRDSLTGYLSSILQNCTNKDCASATLQAHSTKLVQIANSTLNAYNFEYKTSISFKNEYFPTKQYDVYTFEAGYYDAMIIELGDGLGDNWWCVAFPPLCFVPTSEDGDKIVYKSWVKELLEKLF